MLLRMNTFLLWRVQECPAGEEIDLPDDVAAAYLRTGQAEIVQTRITTAPEAAMLPPAQPRGNKNVRLSTTGRQ